MKTKVKQHGGEFWFTARYAATLLKTTKSKIESMVVHKHLRAMPDGNSCFVAEADVTRLRRDPAALKAAKEAAKLAPYPRRGGSMSKSTVYKGDTPATINKRGRIGNALLDEGFLDSARKAAKTGGNA